MTSLNDLKLAHPQHYFLKKLCDLRTATTDQLSFMEKRHHQFITIGGASNRPKYATRHLAALDFLLNVPMAKEESIRRAGILNASRLQQMEENENEERREENDVRNDETFKFNINSPSLAAVPGAEVPFADYAGKKLQGPHCAVGRYPYHFRHHLQKITEHSALVRQWEDQLLSKANINSFQTPSEPSILSNRIYFSRAHCYPTVVCTIVKYDAGEEKARIEKIKAEVRHFFL